MRCQESSWRAQRRSWKREQILIVYSTAGLFKLETTNWAFPHGYQRICSFLQWKMAIAITWPWSLGTGYRYLKSTQCLIQRPIGANFKNLENTLVKRLNLKMCGQIVKALIIQIKLKKESSIRFYCRLILAMPIGGFIKVCRANGSRSTMQISKQYTFI